MPTQPASSVVAPSLPLQIGSFDWPPVKIAIGADGLPCLPGDHVAELIPQFGLLTIAGELPAAKNFDHAQKVAAACRVLGHTSYDAGSRFEQFVIHNAEFAPGSAEGYESKTQPYGIVWTKDVVASSSGCAFYVGLSHGYVGYDPRHGSGFARPVLRVSPGQCFGLLASAA